MKDTGAVTIGWLPKLLATMAVFGVLGYDGVAIFATSITAADKANTYASEAADLVHQTSVDTGYAQIKLEASRQGYTIYAKDFKVAPNGDVTLVVHKQAKSLWMFRIGGLKKYLDVHESGVGDPSS